jgi:hypothetical protein
LNFASDAAYATSQYISTVVPMPTAKPVTAATMGTSVPASACRNARTASAVSSPSSTKAKMSLPAQKSSPPVSSSTATPGSAVASSMAARRATYISRVTAFFFSGRFSRMRCTASERTTSTWAMPTTVIRPGPGEKAPARRGERVQGDTAGASSG